MKFLLELILGLLKSIIERPVTETEEMIDVGSFDDPDSYFSDFNL